MINFPANPTENQIFNSNGKSYQYVSGRWISLVTHMLVKGALEERLLALEANIAASNEALEERLLALEANIAASNEALEAKIAARIGTIFFVADDAAPEGSLICDGRLLSRTTYSDLFAKLGTTYGAGDGSTTFQLPDYRGEFLRGWDGGRGVDADRVRGSFQADQNKTHTHSGTTSSDSHSHTFSATTGSEGAHTHKILINTTGGAAGSAAAGGTTSGTGTIASNSSGTHTHTVSGTTATDAHTHTMTTSESGGTEVRVRNKAELICIWVA